jgi:hypothetical protein
MPNPADQLKRLVSRGLSAHLAHSALEAPSDSGLQDTFCDI